MGILEILGACAQTFVAYDTKIYLKYVTFCTEQQDQKGSEPKLLAHLKAKEQNKSTYIAGNKLATVMYITKQNM